MRRPISLRARLTVVILAPLMIIMAGLSYWTVRDAQERASDRFDRSLLVTALGISRDTAFTGGNALSESTRDLLADTSGGPVFYHVYAPDGVFVTGYATPPRSPDRSTRIRDQFSFYEADYRGQTVRAVRFTDQMTIDGLSGAFTFTVWQDTSVRDGYVRSLSQRTAIVLLTLLASVLIIVWFGIRVGLAPLLDLEDAISTRSPRDLRPIRRAIPEEVRGVVGRLNELLVELASDIRVREELISNAAHQLRNPIAGVLALAEAVVSAKTHDKARDRAQELLSAAKNTSQLAQDLLILERAQAARLTDEQEPFDARSTCAEVADAFAERADFASVDVALNLGAKPCWVQLDRTLLSEALKNVVANALAHGGGDLSEIEIGSRLLGSTIEVFVRDDGKGIREADRERALERFGQVSPSTGSGLGLPIAKAVAEGAGGKLSLEGRASGLTVTLSLPSVEAAPEPENGPASMKRVNQIGIAGRSANPA